MKYLALIQNGGADDNIFFEADDFKSAEKYLKTQIKKGTMFEMINLVDLSSLESRKYFFQKN